MRSLTAMIETKSAASLWSLVGERQLSNPHSNLSLIQDLAIYFAKYFLRLHEPFHTPRPCYSCCA